MEPKLIRKDIKYQKKTLIIVSVLVACLFIGGSFSLLSSSDETEEVVSFKTGNFNLEVATNGTLSLEGELPKSYDDGFKSNDITLTLTNTGSLEIGKYDVKLEGDTDSTLEANYIRYSVSEDDGKTYLASKLLNETNNIIYTGYSLKTTKVLKVKLWIDEAAGEAALKKSYNGKINVELYQNDDTLVDVVKSKLVSNYSGINESFEGGVVAVNSDGNLYHETNSETVREYRYSGLSVNNYVTFNDELWRIVGVFKDASGEEHVKIVRNDVLNDIFPNTYKVNEKTYNIKGQNEINAIWNKIVGLSSGSDWTTAGLQYWLNTLKDEDETKGYLSFFTSDALNMIEETAYYLGNVASIWDESEKIIDTPNQSYEDERGESIWPTNKKTWIGKIGLLYPSDYGFSVNQIYWETQLKDYESIITKSWMYKKMGWVWLISPSSLENFRACAISSFVSGRDITDNYNFVQPTLYLKSNVKITGGEGIEQQPYSLKIE